MGDFDDYISGNKSGDTFKYDVPLGKISKGVERYGGMIKKGGSVFVSRYSNAPLELTKYTNLTTGTKDIYVSAQSAWDVAKELSEETSSGAVLPGQKAGQTPDQIYKSITGRKAPGFVKIAREQRGKESPLEGYRLAASVISVLFATTIFLAMQKLNVTGFAILGMPAETANAGILICVLCIIGILFYKFKK